MLWYRYYICLLPDPEIEVSEVLFRITFERPDLQKMSIEQRIEENQTKTGEKIISLIKENNKITQKELSDKTGLSRQGVEWNINALKQKGIIKRIGPDRGGHWEVIK